MRFFSTLIILILYGLACSTKAMEKKGNIILQGSTQAITLKKKYASQSTTIKELLADTCSEPRAQAIPQLPMQPLDHCLKLIEPYFKLAHKNNAAAITTRLQAHPEQELAHIINAFNYLDVPSIRTAALEALAKRIIEPENMYECLKDENGSYNLPLPGDMQQELADKMVSFLPISKPILLLNHFLSRPESSMSFRELKGHEYWINSVCFSNDGALLASASDDRTVKLWDIKTGNCIYTFKNDSKEFIVHGFYSVCFNGDDTMLAAGSTDHIIQLWDPRSKTLIHTLQGHTLGVLSVCFNANNTQLASGSVDGTLKLWEPQTGKCLHTLNAGTQWAMGCFNREGTLLASASYNVVEKGDIKLWNPKTGELVKTLIDPERNVRGIRFMADGRLYSNSGVPRIWNLQTEKVDDSFKFTINDGSPLFFNEDNSLFATAANPNYIRLWNSKTRNLMHTIKNGFCANGLFRFNKNSTMLAAIFNSDTSSTIKLWPLADSNVQGLCDKKHLKPEQVALLAYISQCKEKNTKPDLDEYPGITKISLP